MLTKISKSTICKKELDTQYSHLKKIISDKRLYDNDANLKPSIAANSIIQYQKKGFISQYESADVTANTMLKSVNRDKSVLEVNSVNFRKSRYKSHNRFDASSVDNADTGDKHRVNSFQLKIRLLQTHFIL